MKIALAPVAGRLALVGVLQLIATLAALVPYVAVAAIASTLLGPGPVGRHQVWGWVIAAAGALVARTVCGGAATAVAHLADAEVGAALRLRMASHLRRVPLGWFTERSSGQVKRAMQDDIQALHVMVSHAVPDLVGAVVGPIAALTYLFTVQWQLTLWCLVPIAAYLVMYRFMMTGALEHMAGITAAQDRLNSAIVEYIHGISVVKVFGGAERGRARYQQTGDEVSTAIDSWIRPMLTIKTVSSLVASPVVMLPMAVAGSIWCVASGRMATAETLPFIMLAAELGSPLLTLGFSGQAIQAAVDAVKRIGELLDIPELPTGSATVPTGTQVRFEDVSFSYDSRVNALTHVNLELTPGTVTALVGPSGSGKSTLAALLPRFWDPTTGQILIGGTDIRDLSDDTLHRYVGFVFQHNILLRTSLRDNIAMGRPAATDAEVVVAARAAQIHERIMALPQGYDTVAHQDTQLSGGEAQRVCIARAILADPPVLVLDEATAFADPESEAAVQDALSTLATGRTVLVIAHRLSTVTEVDQIVVLDHGRVTEIGRHDQLLAADGRYRRMWQAQIVEDGVAR